MNIFACTKDCRQELHDLIYLYLQEVYETGGDIKPTYRSAEYITDLAIEGAELGDPCLVAVVDNQVVGFHISRGLPDVMDTRYKTCHGFGTFVLKAYRNRGIAKELRNLGFETAIAKGYERLEGIAFGPEAMITTFPHGSRPIGVVIVRDKET